MTHRPRSHSRFHFGLLYAALMSLVVAVMTPAAPLDYRERNADYENRPHESQPQYRTADSPSGLGGFTLDSVRTYSLTIGGGTDCWGWLGPDQTKYAFMGSANGLEIVDITHDLHLQTIPLVPGQLAGCG
ncbi:MAG TPA: hypothetical protein VLB27_08575, partial [candidate division Zixibacteria bacterium]|nr:hypothetical protein [candidate division Zixibacteria bacterium]